MVFALHSNATSVTNIPGSRCENQDKLVSSSEMIIFRDKQRKLNKISEKLTFSPYESIDVQSAVLVLENQRHSNHYIGKLRQGKHVYRTCVHHRTLWTAIPRTAIQSLGQSDFAWFRTWWFLFRWLLLTLLLSICSGSRNRTIRWWYFAWCNTIVTAIAVGRSIAIIAIHWTRL